MAAGDGRRSPQCLEFQRVTSPASRRWDTQSSWSSASSTSPSHSTACSQPHSPATMWTSSLLTPRCHLVPEELEHPRKRYTRGAQKPLYLTTAMCPFEYACL